MPLDTEADLETFDRGFAALRGRLVGFWLPGPEAVFAIVAGIDAATFRIRSQELAESLRQPAKWHVALVKDGDTLTVTCAPQGLDPVLFRALGVEAPGPESANVVLSVREDTAHLLTGESCSALPPSPVSGIPRPAFSVCAGGRSGLHRQAAP